MRRTPDQFDGVPIIGLSNNGRPDQFTGQPVVAAANFDKTEMDPRRFDGPRLIEPRAQQQREPDRVEVCRSFSYKISMENYGGNKFEMADFFSSKKTMADAEDAPHVSETLFEECVIEVSNSMQAFISAAKRKRAIKLGQVSAPPTHPTAARNYEAWANKQNGESPI